jgi:heat shock protein HslJ
VRAAHHHRARGAWAAGWPIAASIVAGVMAAVFGAGQASSAPELNGTTWLAETIMGRPVIDFAASTVTFEGDGRIHGNGGCNRYFGTSTIAGAQLSFGSLGATKMACPEALMDQETRFFQALESAERWSFDEHGLLLVHSAGADQPSRFAPFEE